MIINKIGLKAEPHPHPYKVSWINEAALNITQRCLVPIEFTVYKDKIWCDVVTMNVGQIILERPWLFDNNVHIYGRSNMRLNMRLNMRTRRPSYFLHNPRTMLLRRSRLQSSKQKSA